MPQGAALFIRRWNVVPGMGTASGAARVYRAAGFGWGAPVVLRYGSDHTTPIRKLREPAYWQAFRAEGLPLWGCWLLPRPGVSMLREARNVIADLARLNAGGLLIDPELQFKGQSQAASDLAGYCRQECSRVGIGYAVTSYSVTTGHPDFPWREFAEGADWGLAQTYDRDMQFDPGYVLRALASWRAVGFHTVYPCRGLNNHLTGGVKSATDLRRHLALLPAPECAAVWGPPSIPRAQWSVLSDWARNVPSGPRSGPSGVAVLAGLGMIGALALLATGKG